MKRLLDRFSKKGRAWRGGNVDAQWKAEDSTTDIKSDAREVKAHGNVAGHHSSAIGLDSCGSFAGEVPTAVAIAQPERVPGTAVKGTKNGLNEEKHPTSARHLKDVAGEGGNTKATDRSDGVVADRSANGGDHEFAIDQFDTSEDEEGIGENNRTLHRMSGFTSHNDSPRTVQGTATREAGPAQAKLCELCLGINIESLTAPGGYKHASSPDALERSAKTCDLCSPMYQWVRWRTDRQDQLYCSLKLLGRGLVSCLRIRYGDETLDFPVYSYDGKPINPLYSGLRSNDPSEDPAVPRGVCVWKGLTTTASSDSFETARSWINMCSTHVDCSRSRLSFQASYGSNVGPARLLDVLAFGSSCEDARLIKAEKSFRYVALSYCWGHNPDLEHTTRKGSIARHTSRIEYHRLPRTLQDAIKITRELGFRYIWIDALCIIQDSTEDWAAESAKMGAVYSQSALTIAADLGDHSDAGCFNQKGQGVTSFIPLLRLSSTLEDGSGSNLYLYASMATPRGHVSGSPDLIRNSPLHRRGWAWQERLLSTRILHYTQGELMWECHETTLSESGFPILYNGVPLNHWWLSRLREPFAGEYRDFGSFQGACRWYSFMEQDYSQRLLTVPSDKLVAISGVARLTAKVFSLRYLAGLWDDSVMALHVGLCWKVVVKCPSNPDYRCPSWSWASQDVRVHWPFELMNDVYGKYITTKFELKLVSLRYQDDDEFGRVSKGSIKVKGLLKSALFDAFGNIYDGKGLKMGDSWLDTSGIPHQADCFWVCTYAVYQDFASHYMLLLSPRGPGTYSRVGFVKVEWSNSEVAKSEWLSGFREATIDLI